MMKEPPKKIYVQFYGEEPPRNGDEIETRDVTWSAKRIYKWDIVYIRIKKKKRK